MGWLAKPLIARLQVNHPRLPALLHGLFLALLVLNLVAGFRGAGDADGGWRDDAAGGSGVLLGANLARYLAAGGADGRLCAWMMG